MLVIRSRPKNCFSNVVEHRRILFTIIYLFLDIGGRSKYGKKIVVNFQFLRFYSREES